MWNAEHLLSLLEFRSSIKHIDINNNDEIFIIRRLRKTFQKSNILVRNTSKSGLEIFLGICKLAISHFKNFKNNINEIKDVGTINAETKQLIKYMDMISTSFTIDEHARVLIESFKMNVMGSWDSIVKNAIRQLRETYESEKKEKDDRLYTLERQRIHERSELYKTIDEIRNQIQLKENEILKLQTEIMNFQSDISIMEQSFDDHYSKV